METSVGQSDCQISGVLAEQVPSVWQVLLPFVQQALERGDGEYLPEDIYYMLCDKLMQAWLIADVDGVRGLVITELQNFPRKRFCNIVLTAGLGFKDWADIIELIEEWAYANGADAMRAYTVRKGWKPWADRFGYDVGYQVYHKPLRVDYENTH